MAGTSTMTGFTQIAIVDETIREKGWNATTILELATRLGVSRKTVYKLRSRAERWTQNQITPEDARVWRMRQVQALEDIWRRARDAQDYKGAAKAIEIQARLVGTIAAQNVNVNVSGGVTVSPAAIGAVVDMDRDVRQRLLPENEGPAAIEAAFEVVETPTEG